MGPRPVGNQQYYYCQQGMDDKMDSGKANVHIGMAGLSGFIPHNDQRYNAFDDPEKYHPANIKGKTLDGPVFKAVEEINERG